MGITAPRICVETITPSLAHVNKVSYAFRIQEEDITPLYPKCSDGTSPNRLQSYNIFWFLSIGWENKFDPVLDRYIYTELNLQNLYFPCPGTVCRWQCHWSTPIHGKPLTLIPQLHKSDYSRKLWGIWRGGGFLGG